MKKRVILMMIVAVVAFAMTGCWDNIEIDDRAYVLAIGIDKSQIEKSENLLFTFAFSNIQIAKGEGAEISNVVISRLGTSFYCTQERLSTRVDKDLFVGQLKVIIIGEEIAKDAKKMREILDAFERDPLVSRKVRIAIAKGKAKDILEFEAKTELLIGIFIDGLFRTKDRIHGYDTGELGKILMRMHQYGKVAMPSIIVENEAAILEGKAIFNDYKLVDWLDEEEKQILMIIRDESKALSIPILHDEVTIPYCITYTKVEFSLSNENSQMKIKIEIDVEGDIKQYLFNPKDDIMEPEFMKKFDKEVNEVLRKKTKRLINKLQKRNEDRCYRRKIIFRKISSKSVGERKRRLGKNISEFGYRYQDKC
ncbi:MAG: Ger(x)C family spore germination protein [Clostridiales bacterium]|nr:Ger(x)C family spore germination protein [Clostridiales bacterium]